MKHGYQIIEPPSLSTLLGSPSQAAVEVAVLTWVIHSIKLHSAQLFDEVSVEVIAVSYLGTYPAIGIRYKHDDPQDLGPAISDTIDDFVRHASFNDFASLIGMSTLPWCDIWQEMKGKH